MKNIVPIATFLLIAALAFYIGYKVSSIVHKCPQAKAEFYGATIIDADHIERTWIYRDTVEYSKPNINFKLK